MFRIRFILPLLASLLLASLAHGEAPKKLLLVNGATHNNSMRVGSTEYVQAMRELFGFELTAAIEGKSRDALNVSLQD